MSFVSATYVLLLLIAFLLYWWRERWQNHVLLLASLVFYGWWDVRFLLLMVGTALANYAVTCVPQRWGRVAAGLAVTLNLGVLGAFKYYDFFASQLDWPLLHVVLPVGISFYTFQLTAYTIDVQRNPALRERSVLRFLTFVCFFPQLVAGPIERASDLLPQLQRVRRFDREETVEGMRLLLWGLMKKMLVADNCAVVVNHAFGHMEQLTTADLWFAALCFAFQIYGDFSGYSDMAIGSARLFGIRLSRNFDRPYLAASLPDFWRRWHITLMSWLRDYVYIPLGGNRRGRLRQQLNTLCVFLASGVWHGANWTFMAWGLFHALWYAPFRWVERHLSSTPGLRVLLRGLTLLVVLVGWVIFRADSLAQAAAYVQGMFLPAQGWSLATTLGRQPLIYILLLMAAELAGPAPLTTLMQSRLMRSSAVRLVTYYLLFVLTLWLGGEQQTFIYFQF